MVTSLSNVQKEIDSFSQKHLKEAPQLKIYFSSFTKIETKLWTNSTWKPKNTECQGIKSFNLFPNKIFIHILHVCEFPLVRYCHWEDKTYFLLWVLFGHENEEKSLQKTKSKMTNSSKNIQKTSK